MDCEATLETNKLNIPNNWTKQTAYAYFLKGNKSLRFTDEMGCDTGHQIYKPILLYWILQWILFWIIKSLFNGLKHLSLLNWATQEIAYTYSFDESNNMRFMFDSGPTRHCVGNKVGMAEFDYSSTTNWVTRVTNQVDTSVMNSRQKPNSANRLMSPQDTQMLGKGNDVTFNKEHCRTKQTPRQTSRRTCHTQGVLRCSSKARST